MATDGVALRKRQQIANANRMMFLWIAGVSVVVGIAVVASIFLVQKAMFNEKVLSEKSKTARVLEQNNRAVSELEDQVRVLNTNESLKRLMVAGESQPVQVVLDALPADANSSAFGASLQNTFLTGNGITLESLTVDPVFGVEVASGTEGQAVATTDGSGSDQIITFSFIVSTTSDNADALKNLLVKLESSIRPIDMTKVTIEAQRDRLNLRVDGRTYYQPSQTIDLTEKVVKP